MGTQTRYTTPEAAVLKAVDEAGGAKFVGTTLRPEWDDAPDTASRWVHHCCEDSNRSKFGLRQLVWIFRAANRAGLHAGFQAFAGLCGYEATPRNAEAQLVAAVAHAQEAAQVAQEAAQAAQSLLEDNPELMARMKAAGLRVVS